MLLQNYVVQRIQFTASIANSTTKTATSTSTRMHYLDLGCGNASLLQMVSWEILHLLQEEKDAKEKCTSGQQKSQ